MQMIMEVRYNSLLVFLSVIVAVLASYVALNLAHSLIQSKGRTHLAWLSCGALALGVGIWSMHFVGMLATEMPDMEMAYNVPLMILSVVVAVMGSAVARMLKKWGSETSMSETEKREKLENSVRSLMSGIFSTKNASGFDDGKKMLEDAGGIVKSFLSQSKESEIYSKVLSAIGDGASSYSHLSNVSTFAALFSLGTGIGKPEDLALAGLFHDLGLSVLLPHVSETPPDDWSEEDRAAYKTHPEQSLNLIKTRKIVLPQNTQHMILHHHERLDGTGFPKGLPGSKISQETQLLSIADEFDELTCSQVGKIQLKPREALAHIKNQCGFNPELVSRILRLFPIEDKEAA